MSEEDYLLSGKKKRKAVQLMWQDIQNCYIYVLVVGVYYLLARKWKYSSCPSVLLTGFPCPGCGMTRALFSILKGRFTDAWVLHPFSYIILIYGIFFFIRRYVCQKECKSMIKYLFFILAGMIVYYIYRMICFFPDQAPMTYYYGSVLYRIFGN